MVTGVDMSTDTSGDLRRTITPHEFDMPHKFRRSLWYAVTRMWWGYLFTVIMVGFYVYALQYQPFGHTGMLIFLIALVASVGIAVGGTIFYGFRANFYESLEGGITVTFESDRFWVPPERMERLVDEVVNRFEPYYEKSPKSVRDVLRGVHVRVTEQKPVPPMIGHEVVGWADLLNWNVEIYGPYVISMGGFGYEVTHFPNHDLFPNRSEPADVEWMKDEGIWP